VATSYCIVVSYRPNVLRLLDLCGKLVAGGAKVVLVDNTDAPALGRDDLPDGCTLIPLGYNSGIAHAQNVGVRAALDQGAGVLLFFDQDSEIEAGLVGGLTAALDVGVAEIVSPLCIDEATGIPLPAEDIGRYGWSTQVHCPDAIDRYPVDIVISSGMAATRLAFEKVGAFDEEFFIDYVDSEWCLRCRAKGVSIYVVPKVVMRHSIGSRHVQIGVLGISVHGPERCYYQIRNCFLLFRKPHVPFMFSLKQLLITVVSKTLLLPFVEGRLSYAKAYLLAVRDGLAGRTGPGPA
jgi:rhamnosyltransferase